MKLQSLDSINNIGHKRFYGPKILSTKTKKVRLIAVDGVRRSITKTERELRRRVLVTSRVSPALVEPVGPKAVGGWRLAPRRWAKTGQKRLRDFVFNFKAGSLAPQFNFQTAVITASMLFMFGLGAWYAASTPKSEAVGALLTPAPATPGYLPLAVETTPPADQVISNDTLFNTPIDMLQQYFTSPPPAAVDELAARKTRLHEFLKERNSPLEPEADLIAEQPHWKLILAISFAESTLGKRCYMNNCSGIGGANIRTYKSLDNWILDFNRLLENRYKDKTLEQMCGVYVQPCNPNWLLATKQILTGLDAKQIE